MAKGFLKQGGPICGINNTLIVFGVANTVQNRANGDGGRLGGGFVGVGGSRRAAHATQAAGDSPPSAARGSWLLSHCLSLSFIT
jgi:hypothetical protein